MEEFPPNSHKSKADLRAKPDPEVQPEKKVEKVVENKVVRRKKSLGTRFRELFISTDTQSVKDYIFYDVLIPAAKDMVSDATSGGIDRLLFGDGARTRHTAGRDRRSTGHINYQRMSDPRRQPARHEPPVRRSRNSREIDEIILATRSEAEEVLEKLFDLVSRYDTASVGDLYEMLGITPNPTDERWGWTDLRGTEIRRVREGYILLLSNPEPLD